MHRTMKIGLNNYLEMQERNVSELTRVSVYTDDDELGTNCEENEYGEYCEYGEAEAVVIKLKARITELEARLAQTWQPVEDGYEFQDNHSIVISRQGEDDLTMSIDYGTDYFSHSVELPEDVRLCHKVE